MLRSWAQKPLTHGDPAPPASQACQQGPFTKRKERVFGVDLSISKRNIAQLVASFLMHFSGAKITTCDRPLISMTRHNGQVRYCVVVLLPPP